MEAGESDCIVSLLTLIKNGFFKDLNYQPFTFTDIYGTVFVPLCYEHNQKFYIFSISMSQKLFHYVAFYDTLEGTMYYKNNLHNNKFPFEQLGLKMTDAIFSQQETIIGPRFSDLFNMNIGIFDIQIPVHESRDKLTWISFECLFKSIFGTVYISNSINANTYKGNTYVDNLRYLLRVFVSVTESLMTMHQQQDQFQYIDHVTEIQSYYHPTHLETIINNEHLIQQSSVFVEKEEVVTQPMYSPQNNDPLILPLPDYNDKPLHEHDEPDNISLSSSSINVNTIVDDDPFVKMEEETTPVFTEETVIMNEDNDHVLLSTINPIHDIKEPLSSQYLISSPTFKMPELRISQDKTQTKKNENSTTTVVIPKMNISSFFKKK